MGRSLAPRMALLPKGQSRGDFFHATPMTVGFRVARDHRLRLDDPLLDLLSELDIVQRSDRLSVAEKASFQEIPISRHRACLGDKAIKIASNLISLRL